MKIVAFYIPQARSDVDGSNSNLFTPHVLEINHRMCLYPKILRDCIMHTPRTNLPDGFEVIGPSGGVLCCHDRDNTTLFTITATNLVKAMADSNDLCDPIYQAIMAFLRRLPPDYPVIPVSFL